MSHIVLLCKMTRVFGRVYVCTVDFLNMPSYILTYMYIKICMNVLIEFYLRNYKITPFCNILSFEINNKVNFNSYVLFSFVLFIVVYTRTVTTKITIIRSFNRRLPLEWVDGPKWGYACVISCRKQDILKWQSYLRRILIRKLHVTKNLVVLIPLFSKILKTQSI